MSKPEPARCIAGDAVFAVLCGCGHNIRKLLAHLRALLAIIIGRFFAGLLPPNTRNPGAQPV